MILVDTSIWIDHLRNGNERLRALLLEEQVLCHPLVVGELACGSLTKRNEALGLLKALPQADIANHDEALNFLETEKLYSRGLGWIDVHLLASARLSACGLWTLDRPLRSAATRLGISD